MDRREFLEKTIVGGAAALSLSALSCSQKAKTPQPVAKRRLGRTGEMLSMIGFGAILVRDEEQTAANNLVAQAFDRGINYYDVAPTYGNAQDILGPALKPYRDRCFLACKTTQRSREGAEKELNESLEKLQTDHFDLYQLHAITTVEDVETAFGPDGAMEVFLKARQEGKVRFLGFSAHSEQAALLALEKFDFDTTLFPINFVCWYNGNFGPAVVQKARERDMGILALKALALNRIPRGEDRPYEKCWYRPIPLEQPELSDLSLRFTLAQGATAAVPPGEQLFFWRAMEIAPNVKPLSEAEHAKLLQYAEGLEPLFRTV